jgi:hypothetical protein
MQQRIRLQCQGLSLTANVRPDEVENRKDPLTSVDSRDEEEAALAACSPASHVLALPLLPHMLPNASFSAMLLYEV